MKALAVTGIFIVVAALGVMLLFWILAATTPDHSHLSRQVDVAVVGSDEERRASSSDRNGYRVDYTYDFAGQTYVDDQFVPLKRWQPGIPLQACIDPDAPADHTLHLRPDVKCGVYVGTEQTATARQSGE